MLLTIRLARSNKASARTLPVDRLELARSLVIYSVIRILALKFGQDTKLNDKPTFAEGVHHLATVVDAAMVVDPAVLRVAVRRATAAVAAWSRTDIVKVLPPEDAAIAQLLLQRVDATKSCDRSGSGSRQDFRQFLIRSETLDEFRYTVFVRSAVWAIYNGGFRKSFESHLAMPIDLIPRIGRGSKVKLELAIDPTTCGVMA